MFIFILFILCSGICYYLYAHFHMGFEPDHLIPKYTYDDSGFFDVDGVRVHYRDGRLLQPKPLQQNLEHNLVHKINLTDDDSSNSDNDKPTLLLLHGTAASLHTWDGWYDELHNDFRLISLDLPCFGLTGPFVSGELSTQRYLNLLEALLDHLQVEQTAVAGNSFGGVLAWRLALANPTRISKIVLIDASGLVNIKKHNPLKAVPGFLLAVIPGLNRIGWWITPKSAVALSIKGTVARQTKLSRPQIQRYYDLLLRKGNRQALSQSLMMQINDQKGARKQIKTVQQPTLLLWGEQDRLMPIENAKEYLSLLPNATLITYADAGHIPMEEIPKQTAQDARQFLFNTPSRLDSQ